MALSNSVATWRERLVIVAVQAIAATAVASPPATMVWEGGHLAQVRTASSHELSVEQALDCLRVMADRALEDGPYSVVDKPIVPPSGDKHDYLSFSRYWWPNPDTADGLPFVRRDGEVNRKRVAMGDREAIGALCEGVEVLSLAAYLFDDERYAKHAVKLLRVWFLDEATRMNPNLNFAQGVPGRADGRAAGVIDSRHLISVLEGIAVLESLGAIEESEVSELREWFGRFLNWLTTDELALAERRAKNNHGFWYAAQAARVALFVGRDDVARSLLTDLRDRRLEQSILPDGSQPEELKRTLSLHYSLFSLLAISTAASLGDEVGIDLWNHETSSGASLIKAFRYVAPYPGDQKNWPHPMIRKYKMSDRQSALFYLAAKNLKEPQALAWMNDSPRRGNGRNLAPLLFSGR